ncbi:MAG TPA: ABC transporter ATP-binding protein [Candidatus Ratteibacteria bacterium]|nr:ABC transporter ATP-binding protein [Candidatus Ratteibacteria bacterium]
MKKLTKFLKPYKKFVILAPLFMILEVVCDLYQPTLLAKLVDEGVIKGNVDLILKTSILMFFIALIGLVGGILCTIYASFASQNFGCDLREELFKKIAYSPIHSLNKLPTSSLITRLTNDVSQLQQLIMMLLRIVIRAPLLFFGGLVMAIYLNPKLSLIFLFLIPATMLIYFKVIRKSFPLFRKVQSKIDELNRVIIENLSGIRLVRIFMRKDYEEGRFDRTNNELVETIRQSFFYSLAAGPLFMLILNYGIVGVLWFGGILVRSNAMQVGEIIAYINYLMRILRSLLMIANILTFISRASASAERVNEILEIKEKEENIKNGNDLKRGDIIFKNVLFSYNGKEVLKDISFHIKNEETIGITGTTSSGKSTIINLLLKFYSPKKGEILIDGVNIQEIPSNKIREKISVVFQNVSLFSGTIKENILWGNEKVDEKELIKVSEICRVDEFVRNFPDGYETFIGARGVNLSGGQKQRITIARAVIKKPLILILDGATSAIDILNEQKILKGIKEYLNGTTFIIISQRISSLIKSDRIFVMDEGKIINQGNHTQLLKISQFYREMAEIQIGMEEIKNA